MWKLLRFSIQLWIIWNLIITLSTGYPLAQSRVSSQIHTTVNANKRTVDYKGAVVVINGTLYKLVKRLGRGGFGVSYLANSTTESEPLVIKISYLSKQEDLKKRQKMGWTESREEHILKLLGLYRGSGHVFRFPVIAPFFAMKFFKGVNLINAIRDGTISSTRDLHSFERAAHLELTRLHQQGFIHLDVHEGNLIYQYDKSLKNITANYIDYGSAQYFQDISWWRFNTGKLFDRITFDIIFIKAWIQVRHAFNLSYLDTRRLVYFPLFH